MNLLNLTREKVADILKEKYEFHPYDRFKSMIIVPNGEIHDSEWQCMSFIFLDEKDEVKGVAGGYSDVVHMDGIGGYGIDEIWSRSVPPKGWTIDCLPCGYLRLWSKGLMTIVDAYVLSSFEVYSVSSQEGTK